MQLKTAIEYIDRVLIASRNRGVSELESIVFEAIWLDNAYHELSQISGYEATTIRNTASKLLQGLSKATGEQISKKNCRAIIIRLASFQNSRLDLADAPTDIQPFCGRIAEISQLTDGIVTDRCKLIAMMGIGGIGKSAIAAKLGDNLASNFEFTIWKSIREAPPIVELLTEIIQFVSQFTEIEIPRRIDGQIALLIKYLRQHRCLIILDNLESVMESGYLVGDYRSDYRDYGLLLQRLGTNQHQSCILLTSREAPPEIIELATPNGAVRSLFLDGIQSAAVELLNNLGVTGSAEQLTDISEQCQGNPLYLRIYANTILNYFGGSIPEFLQSNRLNFSKITNVIRATFDRLSIDEKLVVYHLAVHREPISFDTLTIQIHHPEATKNLSKTLESLNWRSLLQTTREQRYTLQNVVMEFMTAALIQEMAIELQHHKPSFFLTV